MTRNIHESHCETWDLSREEVERFGGAGRCVIAVDAGGRLLAVLYFEFYHTEAALRGTVARMRGDFPGAVWREGTMSYHQFCLDDGGTYWRERALQREERIGAWAGAMTPERTKAMTGIESWPHWEQVVHECDGLEIQPCRVVHRDDPYGSGDVREYVEPCERDKAEFWTVYGHYRAGGVDAFEDFPGEAQAMAFRDRLIAAYPHLGKDALQWPQGRGPEITGQHEERER